jgi:hypothetical protein
MNRFKMDAVRPLKHNRRIGLGHANVIARLMEAARDASPVSGLTHNFYRYPARFSPKLVRAAIEAFSAPGDLILDPFMGGGTTLVEALALGRHAVGTDISSLAAFVTEVKTTLYTDAELERLERWAARIGKRINMHHAGPGFCKYAETGYYRHLDQTSTWRFRKAIGQALGSAVRLSLPPLEAFCQVRNSPHVAMGAGRKKETPVD